MFQGRRELAVEGLRWATYSDCGEDILELVDEGDERRIVHVDAAWARVSWMHVRPPRGYSDRLDLRRRVCRHGWRCVGRCSFMQEGVLADLRRELAERSVRQVRVCVVEGFVSDSGTVSQLRACERT